MASITNRLERRLAELGRQGKKGLLPYVTAGLGGLETTEKVLISLAELGVAGVELGIPYSDSVADGPTIQESFTRVLASGIKVREILAMVQRFRESENALPIIAMLSYSIINRIGTQEFVEQAAAAGVDGLIVPDLSLEEAPQLAALLASHHLCLSMLVSPTSDPKRRSQIAQLSSGFVYYMSVTGITGERNTLPPELVDNVRQLKELSGKPVVVGFGISTADHVRQVCSVADGAIIGSALVRRMMQASDHGQDIVTVARTAVAQWMAGLR